MRPLECLGNHPCCWKCNLFYVLERLNLIAQRFRSKAFSPACLFPFADSQPLPNYDTLSKGEGLVWESLTNKKGRGFFPALFSEWIFFNGLISSHPHSPHRPHPLEALAGDLPELLLQLLIQHPLRHPWLHEPPWNTWPLPIYGTSG
jgi:hypothetical protein